MHPALLDLATGWAMGLIEGYKPDHLWVPVSYASVQVFRPLPAEVLSHVRSAGANSAARPVAVFDITLATPEGEVCAEIRGFTIRRLEGALAFPAPDPRALEPEGSAEKPMSPAEERLVAAFRQGIRPEEGAEAFGRAVAAGLAQVYVSSLPLPDLIARTAAVEAEKPGEAGFERPDLDNAYVEPRNDIERRLVGFWQELLGVGRVGVEDSFFDLGGHSLIAVRLFAMVKKAFRVEFPISVLFEAPTIAACARLIAEATGGSLEDTPEGAAGEAQATARAPQRRFTHLVPMHQGEGGAKLPFFLVAGMFGNVLNLRHLAHLLGHDRPFYGLQARGLYGDDAPHATFPEARWTTSPSCGRCSRRGPIFWAASRAGSDRLGDGAAAGGGGRRGGAGRAAGHAGADAACAEPPRQGVDQDGRIAGQGPGYLLEWARARREWKRASRLPKVDAGGEAAFHNAAIEAAFRAALPVYDMQPRAGATVLFRPPLDRHWQVSAGRWVSRAREYVLPDNDLGRYAPALEVIEVPGDHDSMVLEPNVRVLAARMRAAIAAVEARGPRSCPSPRRRSRPWRGF